MIGEGSITIIFALLALVTALIVLLFSRRAKQKPIAEYVARGNAYSLQKNYGDAIDAYKRVAQLDPKIKEAYQRLGEIYRLSLLTSTLLTYLDTLWKRARDLSRFSPREL